MADVYDERRKGFNQGVIASLAVIRLHDHETCWVDTVNSVGPEELVRHAYHAEGDWQWAGFERYARRNLGNGEVSAWIRKGPLPYGARVERIAMTDEQRKLLTVGGDVSIPGVTEGLK